MAKTRGGRGLPTPNGGRPYPGQKLDQKVVSTVKTGLNSYLDGVDYLAEKISDKLPADISNLKSGFRGRMGRRRGR